MASPLHNRDDEPTGRTKLVAEFDIFRDVTERNAKRWRFWLQLVGGALVALVVAGIKVGIYMSGIAHKEQVDAMLTRMAVYEKGQQDLADQVREIARTVHAPVLPTPHLEQPAILKETH